MQPRRIDLQPLEPRTHFAAGDPINAFGGNGVATFPAAMLNVTPIAIHETAGGRLLVGVQQVAEPGTRVSQLGELLRFNLDGTLDPNFGRGGVVNTFFDTLAGIVPTAGGRFFAAGTVIDRTRQQRPAWWLARFHADGTLDTRFGNNGKVLVQTGVIRKALRAEMANLSRDGVLTLNGVRPSSSTDGPLAIARFRADGTPDTGFGVGGVLTLDAVRPQAFAEDGSLFTIEQQQDVNTLVVTTTLKKRTPQGVLASNFGIAGEIVARTGTRFEDVRIVGRDLYVSMVDDQAMKGFLIKLDQRGRTDRAFGVNGAAETTNTGLSSLMRQADGKLVNPSYYSSRLSVSGAPDPSIDGTGINADTHVISRDGVLYSTSRNRVMATSLDDRGTPIATRSGDGMVTVVGTSKNDWIDIDAIGDDAVLAARRFDHIRRYNAESWTGLVVEAGSGNDTVFTSQINSVTIVGGAGNDYISADTKTLRYAHGATNAPGTGVLISGGNGNDTLYGSGTAMRLEGNDGADSIGASFPYGEIITGRAPSTLSGGRGDDDIRVYLQADKRGTAGFQFFGDEGNDYLRSSYTSDTLTGGPGRDTLLSGGGLDVFIGDAEDT